MKLHKMMAILAALALALFAFGCELTDDETDAGTSGGGDDVQEQTCSTSQYDLEGDDYCDQSIFYDIDCAGLDDSAFTFNCGKSKCDWEAGICEAMQPCGTVWTLTFDGFDYPTAKPCPNDSDCVPDTVNCEPPMPCDLDGHCDSWCPLDSGEPVDPDCDISEDDTAKYCPGRSEADQCE